MLFSVFFFLFVFFLVPPRKLIPEEMIMCFHSYIFQSALDSVRRQNEGFKRSERCFGVKLDSAY